MVEINGHDLNALSQVSERPSVIKVIRDHHHRIARLIAEGKRTNEVAAEVGMAVSRISILKSDPAFRALIEYYRARVDEIRDEVFASAQQKAALLRENALDLMNDRYEDYPESITHSEARLDLAITNEMLENKPSVQLHGNLKDLPLAEVVNLRRARAESFAKAAAERKLLSVATTAPSHLEMATTEPGSSHGRGEPIPAPTKQTNDS